MKKTIFVMAFATISTACFAQTKIKVSASTGTTPKVNVTVPVTIPQGRTYNLDKQDESKTTNTAIYKGVSYPVYATSKGKLFIKLGSEKTGKEYRKYIKTETT